MFAIGADLIRGQGRLDGPRRVAVTTPEGTVVTLTARHAVAICIGSGANLPDLPGIAEANPWTNRRGTDTARVPDRLAIVGGGGVAVELATAWQGLGSSVTLLARRSGLLPAWNRSSASSSDAASPRPVSTCASASPSPACVAPTQPDRSP